MSRTLIKLKKLDRLCFNKLFLPIDKAKHGMPTLASRGNRPLKMTFDDQLKALVFFHLEEHTSAQHLLQVLEEDDFARNNIAPEEGIKKSSFAEAINNRGLEQLSYIYKNLQAQAVSAIPKEHDDLGDLIIHNVLINCALKWIMICLVHEKIKNIRCRNCYTYTAGRNQKVL